MRRVAPMLLLVAWVVSPAHAQGGHAKASPAPVSQPGKRVISGVVLNAATGQPVTETDVDLADSNGGSFSAGTVTDSEGRFVFLGLPDGKYSLHAQHRGYVASGYDEHEGFFTGIVTGEGLVSTDLKFMLAPQAVLSGTVTDEAGEAVAQASIELFRQDHRAGKEQVVHVQSVNTDDLGHYECARLPAGNYFLAATGTPWYAMHAGPRLRERAANSSLPLDVAFPLTFYDAALQSDEATPIPVKAADRISINFILQAQPATRISIQIPVSSPNQAMPVPELRSKVFDTFQPLQQQISVDRENPGGPEASGGSPGMLTMELDGVPPGTYELVTRTIGGGAEGSTQPSTQHVGTTVVDASSGAVMLDTAHLDSLPDVGGMVAMDDGSSLPEHLTLSFVPDEGEARNAGTNKNGSFSLSGVAAGEYRVSASGPKGEIAVKQMVATGGSVDGTMVKIGTAPVTLAAVLAESNTAVRGFARLDGRPAPGAMIVLIPTDGNTEAFRRDQSDSDGSFALKRVMPGHYTLVAIEDGWTLEWARTAGMQPYLAKGLKVNVALHNRDIEMTNTLPVQRK